MTIVKTNRGKGSHGVNCLRVGVRGVAKEGTFFEKKALLIVSRALSSSRASCKMEQSGKALQDAPRIRGRDVTLLVSGNRDC